jgi:hypothetical protein
MLTFALDQNNFQALYHEQPEFLRPRTLANSPSSCVVTSFGAERIEQRFQIFSGSDQKSGVDSVS